MNVTVLAATRNEIDGVTAILPRIPREAVHEIIIVDGRSSDGTAEFCSAQPGVRVIQETRRGYGNALKEGIAAATGDVIIELQVDGNSIPEKIPDLVAKLNEGYDLVVASRYRDGAKSDDDDAVTRFGNWLFTHLVNWFFAAHYTDALIGYRAFRKDAFEKIKIDAQGLSWSIQLPIQFAKKGFRIAEIGADEPKRIGGIRKMRPWKTGSEALAVLIKEFIRD